MDKHLFLKKIYTNMRIAFANRKHESIFLSFHEIKSNDRKKIIEKSSEDRGAVSMSIIDSLLEDALIRKIPTYSGIRYSLTAKSIYELELEKKLLSEEELISYTDQKYYTFANVNLNDKDKIILAFMLFTRRFNDENLIDLNGSKSDIKFNHWKAMLTKTMDLLIELDLLKDMSEKNLFSNTNTENEVAYLLRNRGKDLPKKTSSIFPKPKTNKYFLDLIDGENNEISKKKMLYIVDLIVSEKKKEVDYQKFIDFAMDIPWDNSGFLSPVDCEHFINTDTDDLIKEIYTEYFIYS